jgi:hypothetical protein
MKILENIITEEEIKIFQDYWNKNNHLSYINAYPGDNHPNKDLANHIDKRLLIVDDTEPWKILRRIVDQYFPNEKIWANYQRQTMAHQIHVDNYGKNRLSPTYTIIITMDDEPLWKTIIFKEMVNECDDMGDFFGKLNYSVEPKHKISETEDIEHCDNWHNGKNYNPCDWLTLDGIYKYKRGWGVLFDTNQLHLTSNWRKYSQFTHRDLIQIHIGDDSNHGKTKFYGEEIPSVTDIKDSIRK